MLIDCLIIYVRKIYELAKNLIVSMDNDLSLIIYCNIKSNTKNSGLKVPKVYNFKYYLYLILNQ